MVKDPIEVRRAIAERFALLIPEELHEHINDYITHGKKHSSRESSISTSESIPNTPVLEDETENIFYKKAKR